MSSRIRPSHGKRDTLVLEPMNLRRSKFMNFASAGGLHSKIITGREIEYAVC